MHISLAKGHSASKVIGGPFDVPDGELVTSLLRSAVVTVQGIPCAVPDSLHEKGL
jgi:hypothetical protein